MRYGAIVCGREGVYMATEYDIIARWFDKQQIDPKMQEWMLFIYNTDSEYWGNQSLWKLFDYCTENGEYNEGTDYCAYYGE